MKPGDHPDFYRLAPPPGASRDSTIVLDRDGRFWHDGERVDHPALDRALRSWISRHPDDGRMILTNGYDWCYFRVEDAPFRVAGLRLDEGEPVTLLLDDETEEPLDPGLLSVAGDGVVYTRVKDGKFEARFSQHAQAALAPLLESAEPSVVVVGGRRVTLPERAAQ